MITDVDRKLRRSRTRVGVLRALVRAMDEGFCVVEMLYDAAGEPVDYRFVETNPAFEVQTGLHRVEGKTIRQLVPDHEAHWFQIYGQVARTGESVRFESPAIAMGRYYDVFAFPLGGGGGNRVGILFKDISERKKYEQDLVNSALYDPLTALPNRAMFYDYLTKALARAERGKHHLGLLFLDLDGFKAINDTLGHQAGDSVLRSVAQRLKSCIRMGDLVSRLGGDEFTIILEDCQPERLPALAEKIIEVVGFAVELPERVTELSISIGIATYPESATDEETLLRRADAAMYAAKRDGRLGYKLWHLSAN